MHLRLAEQCHRALLDDPGAYPAEDVFAALSLDNDAFDSLKVKKLGQQETRRAGTDDSYLCSHPRLLAAGDPNRSVEQMPAETFAPADR